MVYKWFQNLSRADMSPNDGKHSGHFYYTNHELGDGRLKLPEIFNVVGISSQRVYNILHQYLISKSQDGHRAIAHTESKIRSCTDISEKTIGFLSSLHSEGSIHYYMHETKEQSK